jgi:hypothetical protein
MQAWRVRERLRDLTGRSPSEATLEGEDEAGDR